MRVTETRCIIRKTASDTFLEEALPNEVVVLPVKDDGTEGSWYLGYERMIDIVDELKAEKNSEKLYHVYYKRRPNDGGSAN
jgi:hypothetical protein